MTNNDPHAASKLKCELASYVSDGSDQSVDPAQSELDCLLTYLNDTYPDDEVLRVLSWRAWTATTLPPLAAYSSAEEANVLHDELARVERWAVYLEGKNDPSGSTARSLWCGLSACFNPHDDRLEPWFVGSETQVILPRFSGHPC